ncbi:hypothetical protein Tco_1532718 [Tanacetum coccineum]
MLITHQANSQVKDNKIDLLVQQYEQFVIFGDESIDSAIAKFNTIITSLKALDEGYSSKKYVRKFLRALHPKWRAKVMMVEESKDLTSLSLDDLIRNLKVHELIIQKDFEIVEGKGERRSLALKAKKRSSDEESLTSGSEYEEYVMAVRDFKKFFKGRDKNQKAFVGGSWSDSGEKDDEKAKDETCVMAQVSSKVHSKSSYFSDEHSSMDDFTLDMSHADADVDSFKRCRTSYTFDDGFTSPCGHNNSRQNTRLGEVNPTHAYYNGSRTSKDNEYPSWSTSFNIRRTQKTSSALEALGKTMNIQAGVQAL